MMKKIFLLIFPLISLLACSTQEDILVEAENFDHKGGWVVDQQFTFEMGSSYLLAHGMGQAVEDATTKVKFKKGGEYHLYVRTYNWTSPWSDKRGAGAFQVAVGDQLLANELGSTGTAWEWQYAGSVTIPRRGTKTLRLHDLTGFEGRCDAIYITPNKESVPPVEVAQLEAFRNQLNPVKSSVAKYDFVVVGGGISGICAAVSASRLGCKVALINDRPIWGGANSSETRVHLGGHIEMEPYPNLGNMIKEFGPLRKGNAMPADYYEDEKKQAFLDTEKNLTLYPSYRVYAVKAENGVIESVSAKHIETGEVITLSAPLFCDSTGDGTVGYLAGADFLMGREGRNDFNEPSAPEVADKMTMGASVQWYSVEGDKECEFPVFEYGLEFNDKSCQLVTMGEWTWETGMNYDQCNEFERIRDYGLMVVYSNWSYLKNRLQENEAYHNRSLGWVAYVAGKRESRRLLGDHILTENDLKQEIAYPDASFTSTWSIDLHYPDPENSKHFPGAEFKSICVHGPVNPYAVPYRCLYSRNVNNLFMAGRDISVTHIGLGTVRVMRTCGMMGEVVGMAASICHKHNAQPRDVYTSHLDDLKALMEQGVGKQGLPNNQLYNKGGKWPTYVKK